MILNNGFKFFAVVEIVMYFLSVILISFKIEGAIISSNSEEKPVKSNQNKQTISLQLIENSSLLFIEFHAKEETLDMTIKFDLEQFKPSLINGNNHHNQSSDKSQESSAKSSSSSSGNKEESNNNHVDSAPAPSAKKINIGFDFGGNFVDVISVSLMPFEENEEGMMIDQSVINMESPGNSVLNDHVQDFHWNKKDGLLVPDLIQNYELVTFDVEKNGSFISTTISRPWLTCDPQDIQFSLESVEIWWMLEMSDSPKSLNQMLSNSIMFENLMEENGTVVVTEVTGSVTEPSEDHSDNNDMINKNITTVLPPPSKNITLIDPTTNSTSEEKTNPVEDNPTEDKKEIEILKSIKDHDFQGPLILSMDKLLANFTAVFIRGCPLNTPQQSSSSLHKLPTKKEKPTQSYIIYNCSLNEYNSKRSEMKDSPLKIHGLMSMRKLTQSSSSSASSFVEIEAEKCPSSLLLQNHDHDDMSRTLYHALTGKRDKGIPRQGKNNDNGKRGGESNRNSARSVTSVSILLFNNFPCHSHSLLIIIMNHCIISFALFFFVNQIQL